MPRSTKWGGVSEYELHSVLLVSIGVCVYICRYTHRYIYIYIYIHIYRGVCVCLLVVSVPLYEAHIGISVSFLFTSSSLSDVTAIYSLPSCLWSLLNREREGGGREIER